MTNDLVCSICNKWIGGPSVDACRECVEVSARRIAELERELAEAKALLKGALNAAEDGYKWEQRATAAEEEVERLRAAMRRLASSEAFTVSRTLGENDAELVARMQYAAACVQEVPS